MQAPAACARCARPFAEGESPDPHGWCAACRAAVVRRCTWLAVAPALLAAGAFFWLLERFAMLQSRFVIVWLALCAAVGWLTFKVGRRVIFEVVSAHVRRQRRR